MSKKNNTLLWIAGAGIVGWLLAPKEVKEKIQDIMGGGGIGIDLGGLIGGINLGGLMPEFPPFEFPPFPIDWIPPIPEWNPPTDGTEDSDTTVTEGDGGSLMPDLTPFNPSNIQDFVRRGAGIYGRQLGGAFLTGTHLFRPVPFAGVAERAGRVVRTGAKVAPKVIPPLTRFVTHPASGEKLVQLTAQGLGKAAPKLLPKVGLAGLRVGARAIPIVGWALLAVDLGADLLRVFGADMPEWLGVSGLVSAFTGENPLETFFADTPDVTLPKGGGLLGGIFSESSYSPKENPIYPEGTYQATEIAIYSKTPPTLYKNGLPDI